MCMSTDYHGVRFNDRYRHRRLNIQSFSVRFSGLRATKPLPESLTLLYLPRVDDNDNDSTGLVVHGSKVRPHSRAFVSLHREGDTVFASREPVRASDGVRFEVYLREEKVLKGIFSKDEESDENLWVLDCKCALESDVAGLKVSEAEVHVAVEGDVAVTRMVSFKRKRRCGKGFTGLEEIPEETEMDVELDGCDCSCSCGSSEIDGGDSKEGCDGETELDMEGVRWAVDVGIWVMCLGVGFLVSKASAKTLRRIRIL
ncbi:hypothetical protein FNV43_RR25302 [Rhamnella rubrinervis]|uniref:Uncharacterized protein n=1 Tax=Rhamnella rubrinervis TaxID=2594499 RepID=A0A8K0GPZ1_9ROSA|nr:hypothetical protein FNV43_RR25302 [Rhamnella rubrinervis]